MKNEVMDNMEYLMQELHREWARSGPSRISCTLQSTEVSEVQGALAKQVEKQQLLLEREELTFQKSGPAFADELYPASAGEKDEGGTGAEKQG